MMSSASKFVSIVILLVPIFSSCTIEKDDSTFFKDSFAEDISSVEILCRNKYCKGQKAKAITDRVLIGKLTWYILKSQELQRGVRRHTRRTYYGTFNMLDSTVLDFTIRVSKNSGTYVKLFDKGNYFVGDFRNDSIEYFVKDLYDDWDKHEQ